MARLRGRDAASINPREFCSTLPSPDGGVIDVRVQQDASEFLAKLLEGLSEDLNRVQGDKPYVQDPDDDGRSDFTLAKEHWERHLAREDHPVSAV